MKDSVMRSFALVAYNALGTLTSEVTVHEAHEAQAILHDNFFLLGVSLFAKFAATGKGVIRVLTIVTLLGVCLGTRSNLRVLGHKCRGFSSSTSGLGCASPRLGGLFVRLGSSSCSNFDFYILGGDLGLGLALVVLSALGFSSGRSRGR